MSISATGFLFGHLKKLKENKLKESKKLKQFFKKLKCEKAENFKIRQLWYVTDIDKLYVIDFNGHEKPNKFNNKLKTYEILMSW